MRITHSPWGLVEGHATIAEGIDFVSTASHGGYVISDHRRAQMPASIREIKTFAGGNNYEEDCDWALVVLAYPYEFPAGVVRHAINMQSHFKLPDSALCAARACLSGA